MAHEQCTSAANEEIAELKAALERQTAELNAVKAERDLANKEKAEQFLKTGNRAADKTLDPAKSAAAGVLVTALFSFDDCMARK